MCVCRGVCKFTILCTGNQTSVTFSGEMFITKSFSHVIICLVCVKIYYMYLNNYGLLRNTISSYRLNVVHITLNLCTVAQKFSDCLLVYHMDQELTELVDFSFRYQCNGL